MKLRIATLVLLIVSGLLASPARAHFLFIHLNRPAEAGRNVGVYFSVFPNTGDPKYVKKIAHTKLWVQSEPGKFRPLDVRAGYDSLRAYVPDAGTVSVVGKCQYGVITRKVPFLLQYFPKAVAGDPKQIGKFNTSKEVPLEIVADFNGEKMTFTALHNGKRLPGTKFTTVDESLKNEEFTANKMGSAVWKAPANGYYCVYTNLTLKEPGELDGKKYDEVRMFATLGFQWPLVNDGSDDEAAAMFGRAIASRANWQDFPGFTANITGVVDGHAFEGKVTVESDGAVAPEIEHPVASDWVLDQLGSIAMHRMPPSRRRGKPVLRFADSDEKHPLGRLLTFVGGSMASSYRVKDDQITVVNRNLGRVNMTINVLHNTKNAEGKYLPHSYSVQYWGESTGKLTRTETFQNRWKRIGKWDLPTSLTITLSSDTGFKVRSFRLSDHKLLSAK